MPLFISEGLSYPNALKLIEALGQENISANITTGGIAIQPTPDQINRAREIAAQFKASFKPGCSAVEQNIMLKTGLVDRVGQSTDDAIALIKEWEL